jgi:hypothetical protein
MSVNIIADVQVERKTVREPCLCAQMAPTWGQLYRHERGDWASLRPYANHNCSQCQGTGVEEVSHDMRPQLNFANENAEILFRVLGIEFNAGHGDADLATFRRGLIRARNVSTPETLRAAVETERVHVAGYSRSTLRRALSLLEELIGIAERKGATRIMWQ